MKYFFVTLLVSLGAQAAVVDVCGHIASVSKHLTARSFKKVIEMNVDGGGVARFYDKEDVRGAMLIMAAVEGLKVNLRRARFSYEEYAEYPYYNNYTLKNTYYACATVDESRYDLKDYKTVLSFELWLEESGENVLIYKK